MKEQKKKTKKISLPLLIMGILSLVLFVGYLGYQFLFPTTSVEDVVNGQDTKQFPLKKVDWKKELFENKIFTSLTTEVPLQVTIDVGDIGNETPFITTR